MTGGEIQELPEQILIHVHGRECIPADSELNSAIHQNADIAQPKGRTYSRIEQRVVGIAILDDGAAGNGDGSAIVAFTHEAAHRGQPVKVQMIILNRATLERRAGWRKLLGRGKV